MDILQVREIRLYKRDDIVQQKFDNVEECLTSVLNEYWFAKYEQELLFFREYYNKINNILGEEIYIVTDDQSDDRPQYISGNITFSLIDYIQFAKCIEVEAVIKN